MPYPKSVFWKKGQSGNPAGKKKGTKNKKTIEKEERRKIFDEEVSQIFLDSIRKAKAEYLLDQFMGKAPDVVNLNAKIKDVTDSEKRKALKEKFHEFLRNKTNK